MYVNKQLTDEKPIIRKNKQGISYTEIIPAYYAIAIKGKNGKWRYSIKVWRWDIDHLYPSGITFSSLEQFDTRREAIEKAIAMYGNVSRGGKHA